MKKLLMILGLSIAFIACQNVEKEKEVQSTETELPDANAVTEEAVANLVPNKAERTAPTEGARVFFVLPENGATLTSPIHIEMGIEGMAVEPAGKIVLGTGHHHLLINKTGGFIPDGEVVPKDEVNIHFGKGQTEYDLELEPGTYKISLQFANGFHESYGEQMSQTIEIVVE